MVTRLAMLYTIKSAFSQFLLTAEQGDKGGIGERGAKGKKALKVCTVLLYMYM